MRYLEKRGFLCRQKFESLRDEKDHEIFNLREGSQKLQVQLNNGFSGFKDFKEKKAKEIQSLQAQIEDLSKVNCLKMYRNFPTLFYFYRVIKMRPWKHWKNNYKNLNLNWKKFKLRNLELRKNWKNTSEN